MRRPAAKPKANIVPLALVIASVALLSAQDKSRVQVNRTPPAVKPPPMMPVFSDPPTAAEITRARVFQEPLLPIGETSSAAENRQLAALLTAYLTAGVPDGTTDLEAFAREHSESPWRASLLTNLGYVWRRTGHFSRAYRAWELAWRLTRDAPDATSGHTVADTALGEFVELSSRLGHFEELEQLFEEIKDRNVHGAAAEQVSGAKQAVWLMTHEPGKTFRCGPLGLDAVLRAGQPNYTTPQAIQMCPSTQRGTSLVMMRDLAKEVRAPMVMGRRAPGAPVVVPALVHWGVGHFAALVAQQGDKYLMQDPTFGNELWVSRATLDEEATGYFLVRAQTLPEGWQAISDDEGGRVWGKGLPATSDVTDLGCPSCSSGHGMPVINIQLMLISITVDDTPLWYVPSKGPTVEFHATYNQREAFQPQTFWYSNLGIKWTHNWLSYITDDPTNPAAAVTVYQRGGGVETATGFNATTQSYGPTIRAQAVITRTATSPARYERQLPDGSIEVFGQSDGSAAFPRRVFLTESRDAQGNALTFTYDASLRLVSVTDALGQVTTLSYGNADPLKITQVTDPFGRIAAFTYDANGRVASITDLLGLTSSFTYGYGDVVESMTTPYGTTAVSWGEQSYSRWAELTDPLGAKERVLFHSTGQTPPTEPVPTGMNAAANDNLHNTLYWDKRAMALAPGDPAAATDYAWALVQSGAYQTVSVPLSVKRPLERRVYYTYQGGVSTKEGTVRRATAVGRVLDNGTSQVWTYTYNARGRMTQSIDPIGRETDYIYDTTGLDLVQIKQKRGGTFDILKTLTYNAQHEPLAVTDGAGQTTTYTYNSAGQTLTITNAKGETITNSYDGSGHLTSSTGAIAGATTTFGYDQYGRVTSVTDSEGYAVTTAYDAADRPIQITYPDTTFEQFIYDRLDQQRIKDRLGRWTSLTYDANRNIVATRDPSGSLLVQERCVCGSIDAIVDGNGNRTRWDHDVQDRITRTVRPDGSAIQFTYESATSRLKQVTDPKGQTAAYSYAQDDALQQTSYSNAVVPTAGVTYTYDASYARLVSLVDGQGTTTYAYNPIASGQLGAGQLASIDGPFANDTITFTYDELGRVVNQAVNGIAASTTYDAIGRVTAESNALGAFSYAYVGASNRTATITYPNNQIATYSYYGHSANDRLLTLQNTDAAGGTLSRFDYTYDARGNVLTWQQQAGTSAPTIEKYTYDADDELLTAIRQTTDVVPTIVRRYAYQYDLGWNRTSEQIDDALTGATYNTLNQMVSRQSSGGLLFAGNVNEPATVTIAGRPAVVRPDNSFSGTAQIQSGTTIVPVVARDPSGNSVTNQYQITSTGSTVSYSYDANGNLVSDGTSTYEWDAVNELVAISSGTHRTEYQYDGLHRRAQVIEKENGVTQSSTQLIWCGELICEERSNSGSTIVRRFSYGDQVAGVSHFVTTDHLGSVREVTDNTSGLLSRYSYDPWGRRTLVSGTDLTSIGFTGHQQATVGALWLTLYRPYSAEIGRWLTEDPVGLSGGINLQAYVENAPISSVDPFGLQLYVPGPPPNKPVPPGCSASWRFLDHWTQNLRRRGSWHKVGEFTLEVAGPRLNGKNDNASLTGQCYCEWELNGFVQDRNVVEKWQRTVTCCGMKSTEPPDETSRRITVPVPSIFAPIHKTTPGQAYNGQCNCPFPD